MKKVLLEMELPDWVKWKATDWNGKVWVFSHEPTYTNGCWLIEKPYDIKNTLFVM